MTVASKSAERAVKRYWPLAIAAVFLIALFAAWATAPAEEWIRALTDKVKELGWAAPIVYVALYIVGAVVLAPSPIIGIAAGVAFGWWGIPLALIGATVGATISFLIGRYVFNDTLDEWLTDRRIFRAVKRAIDEEGWRVLLLLRLTPAVPFGLLNYFMGTTKISLATYVSATALGILPGTVVNIYIGVIGQSLATGAQVAYLVAGGLVTVTCAIMITLKARKYLREAGVKGSP